MRVVSCVHPSVPSARPPHPIPQFFSMEALRERFYNVCRMILCSRAASTSTSVDVVFSEQPLAHFFFDVAHERQRKLEFERLYSRSECEASLLAGHLLVRGAGEVGRLITLTHGTPHPFKKANGVAIRAPERHCAHCTFSLLLCPPLLPSPDA